MPMKIVDMQEAKTTLSQLVAQVENGEEVILSRADEPVARVAAIRSTGRRSLGHWRGRVRMSDDFDAPLPEAEQQPGSASPMIVQLDT